MSTRTSSRTVSFARPFHLSGVGETLPAGSYTVETEEALLEDASFPAYRRTATLLMIPPGRGGAASMVATIDPQELSAALDADAQAAAGMESPPATRDDHGGTSSGKSSHPAAASDGKSSERDGWFVPPVVIPAALAIGFVALLLFG